MMARIRGVGLVEKAICPNTKVAPPARNHDDERSDDTCSVMKSSEARGQSGKERKRIDCESEQQRAEQAETETGNVPVASMVDLRDTQGRTAAPSTTTMARSTYCRM